MGRKEEWKGRENLLEGVGGDDRATNLEDEGRCERMKRVRYEEIND